jgi:hypothetical protein
MRRWVALEVSRFLGWRGLHTFFDKRKERKLACMLWYGVE